MKDVYLYYLEFLYPRTLEGRVLVNDIIRRYRVKKGKFWCWHQWSTFDYRLHQEWCVKCGKIRSVDLSWVTHV